MKSSETSFNHPMKPSILGILAAAVAMLLASCGNGASSTSSMPGMTAEEHAAMKKN